ncbi:addiction module protein [Salegentibacter salegens]|uniref:Putative addiction module component n=1 Tax=Salegentibacter salegens TaxID=143223 RepID=A0A1M7MCA3_9FLAO|nr:addiction module protein [Salegentibacter salegens]PRX51610.1 putative addiction module component [Salegentibacter salegens]SHM88406.1 Putative addiction module component [Salegentibacter salegens]
MDLVTRKYNLIHELTKVKDEHVIEDIEKILCPEITTSQKEELDNRIKSFEKNPENLSDWDSFKETW